MNANTSKTQWLRSGCVGSQIQRKLSLHGSGQRLELLLNPGCHPCAHEKGPLQTQGWGGDGGGA